MFRLSTICRKLKGKRLATSGRRTKTTRRMDSSDQHQQQNEPGFIPRRTWEPTRFQRALDRQEQSYNRDHTAFTVVSYNILAQDLLESHPDLYRGIPREHLQWNHRQCRLIDEISHLSPDILCLQEIQCSHLEQFSAELLRRFTFDRVFKKRTGSEKTDGCAIFFNADLFELIDTRTIEFNQEVSLLDRDNVAIVLKLRSRANPQSIFIVSTTHLLFNPRRLDIKLAQVHVLLAELEQMSFNNQRGTYYPIILTGDFNMVPYSAPFNLITDGRINYHQLPQKQPIIGDELGITDNCQHVHSIKYGRDCNESQLIHSERTTKGSQSGGKRKADVNTGFENLFNTGFLTHPLHLTSTTRHFWEHASTYHDKWLIVDFLFYSRYFNSRHNRVVEGDLKLLAHLELPSLEDCQRMGMIPNQCIGSDHFSLAARFLLRHPSQLSN